MLKKIILILALICMIVLLIFVQTGNYITSRNIVECADYDHPDDAITAISSNNKTLLVTEAETCDNDFTVPTNVTVKFERGGKWTINNGITVTFNGQIEAGLLQVFEYSGTRPERWLSAEHPFAFGYWAHSWASDYIAITNIDTANKRISKT